MFVAYRKDLTRRGDQPTLLYGYGGFNVSLVPQLSITRLVWMEMGGMYAAANLRGGGKYGEDWHEAGTKLKKQNVFDDFIATAEPLIAQGRTRPQKLAIFGVGNGGLLVGAVLNQRPDLFGAAAPAVGVVDMLRFDEFMASRFWVDDYGTSDDAEQFQALWACSLHHNIKKGIENPAVLATTADKDDRVVPGHSFKYTPPCKKPKPEAHRCSSGSRRGPITVLSGPPTRSLTNMPIVGPSWCRIWISSSLETMGPIAASLEPITPSRAC